jgi:hypothetical protein
MNVDIKVKCTACMKTQPATEAQKREAHELGCFISRCCHAVATVQVVTAAQRQQTQRGAPHAD